MDQQTTSAVPQDGTSNPEQPKRRRRRGGRRHHHDGAEGAPTQESSATGAAAAPQAQADTTTAGETVRKDGRSETRERHAESGRRDGHGRGRGGRDGGRSGHGGSRRDDRGPGVDLSFVDRPAPVRPAGPTPEVDLPAFAELGLKGDLLAGVAAMGYEVPTPIQEQAIPRVLAGRDVVGCAQTGTGKTAAFVLPMLQRMNERAAAHGEELPTTDGRTAHPRALVVTPTRELCAQIEEVGQTLSTYSGRTVLAVFGGVPYEPQAKKVRRGVDLLVATPGRLLDMLRQGDILLDRVDTLVLDEADRMLDMGFWPDVKRIIDAVPVERQNLFFSATMTKTVLSIIEDTLHKPVFIELGGAATPIEAIAQSVLPVNYEQKVELLVEYFRHHDPDRTLVFARTRRRAERLARTLEKNGISCEAIHGDRTQGQRQQALAGFKAGKIKVLVATDVVARGIDVEGISHVINYDIPANPEDYIHRIGRTARAGASGIAVSLLTGEDVHELKAIERLIGQTLERHDLPEFDYEKRNILESSQVQPRPGKMVYRGGALRSWNKTGVKRRVPGRTKH